MHLLRKQIANSFLYQLLTIDNLQLFIWLMRNSIIDNQTEMQANYFVVDEKFMRKRVAEQIEYMEEIVRSSRHKDRKVELLTSSQAVLLNLLLSYYGTLCGAVMFTIIMAQVHLSLSKPVPSFHPGGIVPSNFAMVGEQGIELTILNRETRKVKNLSHLLIK